MPDDCFFIFSYDCEIWPEVGHSQAKKNMWATSALRFLSATAVLLLRCTHGRTTLHLFHRDVLLDHLEQVIGHGNHDPSLSAEKLELLLHLWRDVRLDRGDSFHGISETEKRKPRDSEREKRCPGRDSRSTEEEGGGT
mgnify:CR=1 FL=1